MTDFPEHRTVTNDNVEDIFEYMFAPWVKAMDLRDFDVRSGTASALLPQNPDLQWANGAICGQAIMAAIDTVVALAMSSTNRQSKGTASLGTQFLRPAIGEDLRITARVLQFGSAIGYAEASVTFALSGKLVAHSTSEFAF